ncbi:heme-degrading domain-containing protein [bacterium]|nr:heme-degrading domain-containing protein [bacterium]
MTAPTLSELEGQEAHLLLPAFDETIACRLGSILLNLAQVRNLPVVINIRSANRTFFHAALPGSSGNNDNWARRKSNTALLTGHASLMVGMKNAASGRSLATEGLSETDYADHGGAVPLRVKGAGVVAVATVSGLPQIEDHKLVVAGIEALLG